MHQRSRYNQPNSSQHQKGSSPHRNQATQKNETAWQDKIAKEQNASFQFIPHLTPAACLLLLIAMHTSQTSAHTVSSNEMNSAENNQCPLTSSHHNQTLNSNHSILPGPSTEIRVPDTVSAKYITSNNPNNKFKNKISVSKHYAGYFNDKPCNIPVEFILLS